MADDSVHDKLFYRTFSKPEHAEGILKELVPASLKEVARWDTLRLAPTKFVDRVLGERRSDLIYQIDQGEKQAFIVLLEHQSRIDPQMAARMFIYVARLWEAWLKDHPTVKKLPAVLPLVLYHGVQKWNAATEVSELIDLDADTFQSLLPYLPRLSFKLEDLSQSSPEAIRSLNLSQLGHLVLDILQFLRSGRDEPERYLKGSWDLLLPVIEGEKVDDFVMIVRYIEKVVPAEHQTKVEAFMQEHLSESKYGEFVSIADARWNRGVKRGRLEGQTNLFMRQLKAKFGHELPQSIEERLDGASTEELEDWSIRLLTAETLAEIFA